MKKKLFTRCLIGAPIGLAISTLITIIISLIVGDGNFYAIVPELLTDCGTEMNAVLLQTVCSLIYGAAWAGASLIFENEKWSLLRQTVTHLIVVSLATFPSAFFMRWMDHTVLGILLYYGSFFGIYLLIWTIQYFSIKKKVQQMNDKIKSNDAK